MNVVHIGNSTTIPVQEVNEIELKLTFENIVTLTNVLYVSKVRKNLLSDGLLNKFGFKLIFEPNEFVLSKSSMFVCKSYLCNGMFNLNILAITNNKNDVIFAYLDESCFSLWHNKCGHANYRKMYEMMKPNLLRYCGKK